MSELLIVVPLIAVVVAVSALASRLRTVTPIVLVVVGIALSFAGFLPGLTLSPELILVGVLPPLLYVAALETSVPAFRFNLRPILLLAVGLVLVTAGLVALVIHLLLPDVPIAAAIAIGAVVAPPDAVAATSIARRIGLPRRLVTILEGESLINDATALVIFTVASAALVGEHVSPLTITEDALLAAVGGVLIGAVGGVLIAAVHRRITDPLLDNAVSLLTPFLVFIPAHLVHSSGVVAVVVTGLFLGHRVPTLMSAASRLQMEAFWRMVKFLLEGLVFLLVGLQLRAILDALDTPLGTVALVTVAVLATVVVARFGWMYPATYLARLVPRIREREPRPALRYPTVIAWAGMRGVVTLAAALALPPAEDVADGQTYPRDLFVWLAFSVIMGTLVLQGVTLPALVRRLGLESDDPRDDALAQATVQQAASRAARQRLDAEIEGNDDLPAGVVSRLRTLVDDRTNLAWERLGSRHRETPSEAYGRLRRAMLDAEREVFRQARDEGRIPEEVLRRAQRDMDLEESILERSGDHDLYSPDPGNSNRAGGIDARGL